MRLHVALVLFVIACGGGAKSGTTTGATTAQAPTPDPIPKTAGPKCASVADHLANVLITDVTRREAEGPKAREKMTRMCEADGWSDEARSCLATAQSDDELDGCTKLFTEAQRSAFTGEAKAPPAVDAAAAGGRAVEAPRKKSTTRAPVKKAKGGDSDPCEGGE